MTETGYLIAAIFIAVIYGIYSFIVQPLPLTPIVRRGYVSYVIDGDTLIIKGVKRHIRLWGVDAPDKGEQGQSSATDALKRIAEGKWVSYIIRDQDEKYHRIVAQVFLPNGKEINRLMIEQGYAKEYCYFSKGFYGFCDKN